MSNKRQVALTFRVRWEGEIRDQLALGQADDAVSFWDNYIAAQVDDGNLPETARSWTPPAWLVALDKEASMKH